MLNKCSPYAGFIYIGICIYSWHLLMSVSYSGISVSAALVAEVSLAFRLALPLHLGPGVTAGEGISQPCLGSLNDSLNG